ncbi:MAG: sensor histidine kinase [Thermoleophilia bacterium]
MESSEAVNQADAGALTKPGTWFRWAPYHIVAATRRVKSRPLFQKVIIANTVLIILGTLAVHLGRNYFTDGELDVMVPFLIGAVCLSVPVNYFLVKMAFRPLNAVTDTMKAIRSGRRGIRIPEVTDDAQIAELSRSLKSMLDALERERKLGAASTIKAQEEERKRIARELHDETSQSLTGLMIGIRMTEKLIPESMPEIRARLQSIEDLAHATLGEVHTMATKLRPSVLDDLGLSAALRSYVKEFTRNTEVFVDLQVPATARRLPPELETVLYRVIQEGLTNVARHSGADSCSVRLEDRGNRIIGFISDNGCGFEPGRMMRSEKTRGLGLHGMKERIELVDGFLEFESHVNAGSIIHLEVPIESKEGSS